MTKLTEDIDNFSGKHSRGTRYDIKANGEVIYHDIAESAVDALVEDMEKRPYLYDCIEVKEI